MTGYVRLADVQSTIFETPIMNDRFTRERTVLKNSAMSESRTFPPDAGAAKLPDARQSNFSTIRGGAAPFPESGH